MNPVDERQLDSINSYLDAYPADLVRQALRRRQRHARGERIAGGWRIWTGPGETPPKPFEWRKINGVVQYRDPPPAEHRFQAPPAAKPRSQDRPKTDLSMKPTDKTCPLCGEVMAWEPICPGCALGRMGFAGRYVCMDDFAHEFYVLRDGIELPNR